jgi:ATP-dependent Lon protease
VRNLEREIASLCRKIAKKIVKDKIRKTQDVTKDNIHKYLGVPKYHPDYLEENEVGVATGLAWTEVGGDTLAIEVSVMKGKGKLTLTGKLGEVMQESAQAALSYIRSNAKKLKLKEDFLKDKEIHVHVPEGAIPKDGPSAGITLATAMLSALTNKPVKKNVAMTGEITLRGHVLPIGGLKEKVLAAYRTGIKTVLIPQDNKKDMEEIPDYVQKKIKFITVKHISDVFKEVFL